MFTEKGRMRFSRALGPLFAAALGAALPAVLSGAAASAGDAPSRWIVKIRLEARGRYLLTRDANDFAGDYAYEAVWTGSMESDFPDYLLYHASAETVRWELKERSGGDGAGELLFGRDSPVRPAFRMNYVLAEGGRLCFFFTVEGFPVPRNESPEKFALVFPSSREEAAAPSASGYDEGVGKGSNDVSVDEKELRGGRARHVFRWAWKRYHPSSAPPPAGPLLSTHEAKVTLTVTADL
jgi:hypothetical protein